MSLCFLKHLLWDHLAAINPAASPDLYSDSSGPHCPGSAWLLVGPACRH